MVLLLFFSLKKSFPSIFFSVIEKKGIFQVPRPSGTPLRCRGDKTGTRCPEIERKKVRTTFSTITDQLSEFDKETSMLSYVQDEHLGNVNIHCPSQSQGLGRLFLGFQDKEDQSLMSDYSIRKGIENYTICFLFDGSCPFPRTFHPRSD